jgi:hypothetical protein
LLAAGAVLARPGIDQREQGGDGRGRRGRTPGVKSGGLARWLAIGVSASQHCVRCRTDQAPGKLYSVVIGAGKPASRELKKK